MLNSDTERRVLANLPRFRSDEDHAAAEQDMREANGYEEDWALKSTRPASWVAERLAADQHADDLSADGVNEVLLDLESRGLCAARGSEWAMTEAGLAALTA